MEAEKGQKLEDLVLELKEQREGRIAAEEEARKVPGLKRELQHQQLLVTSLREKLGHAVDEAGELEREKRQLQHEAYAMKEVKESCDEAMNKLRAEKKGNTILRESMAQASEHIERQALRIREIIEDRKADQEVVSAAKLFIDSLSELERLTPLREVKE